jgi:hypothetical protein
VQEFYPYFDKEQSIIEAYLMRSTAAAQIQIDFEKTYVVTQFDDKAKK